MYDSQVYYFDYSDLLYYSNKYILEKGFFSDMKYEYIIIDEYQDISDGEYLLAKKTTLKNNSRVFAVGDDWQSIYSFRGSNINYITRFNSYFEHPTVLSIKNTYRNSQELINVTGDFIKKNKDQIDKDLISFKHNNKPIYFEMYDDRVHDDFGYLTVDETKEYEKLKELIKKIHSVKPEHNILILARNNKMIDNCFKYDKEFIDDLGTKIRLSYIDDLQMDGMTIHKAKGLTYDEVIIIGMNNNFPKDIYNNYWMIDLFKPKLRKEAIEFAEERRIFYVALTRTRNNVFILTNRNAKNRSRFVDELAIKYREIMGK